MELEVQKEKEQTERELRSRQLDIQKLELELKIKQQKLGDEKNKGFDVAKFVKLIPLFQENEVDKFFLHFEKLATNLKWPEESWTTLVQSVLVGKAQEVYAALSIDQSSDYQVVKSVILKAYELVPEAYRQKFRNCRKHEGQTYVEFARNKVMMFDRWCSSKEINKDYEKLKQLTLVEEFKRLLFPFTKSVFEKVDFQILDTDKDKAKFRSMIKQVIEDRKNNPDSDHSDILQAMLDTHKEESSQDPDDDSDDDTETKLDFKYFKKRGLTNYEIFCNSHIFLLAGYDTTSNALTFTAYLLAKHPEIQEKLYQSIRTHIGDKKPTYADVTKLQYLENVFLETLRLYPPATRITRVPAKSTNINGYHIPAGLPIIIPVYAIQHDPEFWSDPEKFDPDRFLPENKHELHNYMWMPFGVGPRNCLGMRLALLEAKMAIVALVQNFRFVVSPETEASVKLEKGGFVRPENNLYIGVERRQQAS
ncbi:cytochrome P450 3A41-like [Haliotis rubra]|uniref:cytochrome P450 3A41-like n=1 Tax=Haliotis rubra TaxID=36100 RepID=UPI001EE5CD72|nr:cytochrome P450 3A41-like [Haliotis rubra]